MPIPSSLELNFVLLHVDSAPDSALFYERLLGRAPVESSPTFATFGMASGLMLGLWAKQGVEPEATAPGGCEISFAMPDRDAVDALHAQWTALGLAIAQPPTDMDFGRTFVALDPDGHRLRVFAPAGP